VPSSLNCGGFSKHRENYGSFTGTGSPSIAWVQIVITVDEVRPLRGEVTTTSSGTSVAFSGWLPLLGILERLTASADVALGEGGDELGAGGH
jgi:hypothetical protein